MSRLLPLLILSAIVAAFLLVQTPASAPSAHASFGRGPAIVLVHGLGSRRADWLPVARELARDHRVTLVDLPGHGVTEMPAAFSLDQAQGALDRALGELGEQPVVLVGHSVGGLVCTAEALARPGRVRALVLVESALRTPMSEAERRELLDALGRDYAGVLRAAYLDFGRDSLQGEALLREVSKLDPAIVKRWIRLAVTTDLSQRAASLTMPVTAVWAPRTWGPGESWADVAAQLGYERVPRLDVVRVPDAGHFVMLDRPHELASIVARAAARPHPEPVATR